MTRIDEAVGRASEGQSRIAAAVEQQAATTTEMVGRLADIARGLDETAEAMAGIATNAGETARESLDLTALAEQLTGMAAQLDTLVKSQGASAAHAAVKV
jgi:methyl-accepting chemotaxis protein